MRLVKPTSFSVSRLFVIVTVFVILIGGIVIMVVNFSHNWKEGAYNFTLFYLPILILGFFPGLAVYIWLYHRHFSYPLYLYYTQWFIYILRVICVGLIFLC